MTEEKTYILRVTAKSKQEALTHLHDLATELLDPAFTKAVDANLEEESVTLDDSDLQLKILEVAQQHAKLCPGSESDDVKGFSWTLQGVGHYDRDFSQEYVIEEGKVHEEGFPDDGDYGESRFTHICCGDCGEELWPNPAEGVLAPSRGEN